jgi:hypothetical protein
MWGGSSSMPLSPMAPSSSGLALKRSLRGLEAFTLAVFNCKQGA